MKFFRINGKPLTDGENWDFTISERQKRIAAFFCFLLSGGLWFFFSTPNTLLLCAEFGKNFTMLGSPFMGQVLGISAGLGFSIGEYAAILFICWKRQIIFVIILVVCMGVSILATMKYTDVGNQHARIAQDKIDNQEKITHSIENNIRNDSSYVASLQADAKNYQDSGQKVPEWIHKRIRQANQRTQLNTIKLENATKSLTQIKDKIGVQVSIGDNKGSWWVWTLSVLLELVIVFFGFVAIGIYQTNPIDERTVTDNGKMVAVFDNGQVRFVNQNEKQVVNQPIKKNNDFEQNVNQSNRNDLEQNVNQNNTLVDTVDNNKRRIGFQCKYGDSVTSDIPKPMSRDIGLGGVTNEKNNDGDIDVIDNRIKLQKLFVEKGKSDDTILYLFDHITGKNYRRISIMAGDILSREPVNREYVRRVLKREGRVS